MAYKINKRSIWKLAAIAALSATAIGAGATATQALSADADATTPVASVTVGSSTTEYASIEDAFAVIASDTATQSTIVLLDDVSSATTLTTPKGESTTIDLGGYTLTANVAFYGNDEVKDSGEDSTGTVACKAMVEPGAVLRIRGGNFSCDEDYPLYVFQGATAIVSGGSFDGGVGQDAYVATGGKLSLKTAEFPTNGVWLGGTTLQDALDVSAKYYDANDAAVTEGLGVNENTSISSVKQEYIAALKQGTTEKTFASLSDLKTELETNQDADVAATITLHADILESFFGGRLSTFADLTLDLNGNQILKQGSYYVQSGHKMLIKDSLGYGLYGGESSVSTFLLNKAHAETGAELTLQCDTQQLYIRVYEDSCLTVDSGTHQSIDLRRSDASSARAVLNGGSYGYIYLGDDLGDDWTLADILPENYEIKYADGTYENDLTKNSIDRLFSVAEHIHDYVATYDETNHWKECRCGDTQENSQGAHENSNQWAKDADGHWYACTTEGCAYKFDPADHTLSVIKDSHVEEDGADVHTVNCATCGYTDTQTCDFEDETIPPTPTEDGYILYTCACGYTYREDSGETAFGDRVFVTIGGVDMTVNSGAYYVNGENGATGTVYAEEPETWHAKLDYQMWDEEIEYSLILNGLNVSTTDRTALLVKENAVTIIVGAGTVNTLTVVNETSDANYVGALESFNDLSITGNGTLHITLVEETGEMDAYGIVVTDYLGIGGITLNVNVSACGNEAYGIFASELDIDNRAQVNVTLDTDSENEELVFFGIATVGGDTEVYGATVSITLSDAGYAYGLFTYNGGFSAYDSTVTVTTGKSVNTNMGIMAYGDEADVYIKGSTVTVSVEGRTTSGTNSGLNDLDVAGICKTAGDETSFSVVDSRVDVTITGIGDGVGGIYGATYSQYEGACVSGIVIEDSAVNVDVKDVVASQSLFGIVGIVYGKDNCVENGLRISGSDVYVEYGIAPNASGITAAAQGYGTQSSEEALVIEDSVVYVQGVSLTVEEVADSDVSFYREDVAIYVVFIGSQCSGEQAMRIENSEVTAIAGDGADKAAGLQLESAYSEEIYLDAFGLVKDSKLTAIGGNYALESYGIGLLNAEIELNFGLWLQDSEVVAIGGDAMQTAGMYLSNDSYLDELLYIDGGHTVAIAPEEKEIVYGEETTTYNTESYALVLIGDDGEIVRGKLELFGGSYVVESEDMDADGDVCIFVNDQYDNSKIWEYHNWYINGESAHDIKYALYMESGVYIGNVVISEGQYYVNGKNGGEGKVYSYEPETWNAKLEAVYDEYGDLEKYVLYLNGLQIASQENSLIFAQIFSLADVDIVLMDGSENVVEANVLNETYAAIRTASAIELWKATYDEDLGEDVYEVGGTLTVSGDGSWKVVGESAASVYADMETYLYDQGLTGEHTYLVKDLTNSLDTTGGYLLTAHVHVESDWIVDAAATCTQAGSQHKECTDCGDVLETETLDATGHSYGEWTVVQEATKEEAGLQEKVCAHCGDKIAELIPEEDELSDGGIVAISIGATVGAGVLGFSLVWFVIKKKKFSDLIGIFKK